MSNFDLLHPALQHHIVNALGWKNLRPFQDDLIPSIMDGKNHIVLAPTAGGKTEAAFFPLLSRMASEDWQGLSVLYICPLRALLNNLYDRAVQYSGFVGRRAGVWHGDILASEKKAMLREPPDILMTTPESLEGILISANKDHRELLSNVRAIVVDEVHAFAGDDRGWHMLFVLQRILGFSKHESIQRLGLSATVGNPEYLMDWIQTGNVRPSRVYLPSEAKSDDAGVTVDYVARLDNAATVISRMHRGAKRLVFVDSRLEAERLGKMLRELQVDVYVTHGSLSREQRLRSEQAFAERSNCVIVATSVLELGVDIGSLDHVIQIDSPSDVASFLQRMGRTGRRINSQRNCLFLTLENNRKWRNETVMASALLELWKQGFVESAIPPSNPLHIVGQQLMALALQNHGIGRDELIAQIVPPLNGTNITKDRVNQLLDWMLENEILFQDTGIISMGRSGEEEFGRRHFIELVSVFSTPPIVKIRHGRQDVGEVCPRTFLKMTELPGYILLAGRSWQVNHIDWRRQVAYVEPVQARGTSVWSGDGPDLSYELCQAYKAILVGDDTRPWWSNRARTVVEGCRRDYDWLVADSTVLTVGDSNHMEWWTFAGTKGNTTLAAGVADFLDCNVTVDPFFLRFQTEKNAEEVCQAIESLRDADWTSINPAVREDAITGLKFNACMPDQWARQVLQDRLKNTDVAMRILAKDIQIRFSA